MCDQLASHCAELTPGVATATAAIGTNATATSAARRRTNLVIAGPFPEESVPHPPRFSLCPRHATTHHTPTNGSNRNSLLIVARSRSPVGECRRRQATSRARASPIFTRSDVPSRLHRRARKVAGLNTLLVAFFGAAHRNPAIPPRRRPDGANWALVNRSALLQRRIHQRPGCRAECHQCAGGVAFRSPADRQRRRRSGGRHTGGTLAQASGGAGGILFGDGGTGATAATGQGAAGGLLG